MIGTTNSVNVKVNDTVSTLTNNLNNEINARQTADNTLQSNISTVQSTLQNTINNLLSYVLCWTTSSRINYNSGQSANTNGYIKYGNLLIKYGFLLRSSGDDTFSIPTAGGTYKYNPEIFLTASDYGADRDHPVSVDWVSSTQFGVDYNTSGWYGVHYLMIGECY